MFPIIDLGFVKIPIYSALFFLGFLVAVLAARKAGGKFGIAKEDVLYAAIYAAIGILIGAKLLYFFTKVPVLIKGWAIITKEFHANPMQTLLFLLNYSFGGMVFYGGLIGAVFGVWRYCRRYRLPFVPYLDIFAPLIPFIHGVGRIGCFCSGCCYGIEYHGPGSVQFPHNELIKGLDAVPRFPVQLLEAGMNFILCVILLFLSNKKNMRGGRTTGIYLIYYAIARFGLEMLRGDKIRGSISLLSTSQWISLFLLPVGILLVHGRWLEKHCKERQSIV